MRNTRCGAIAALLPLLAACAMQDGAEPTAAAEEAKPPSPWDAAKARGVEFRAIGNEPGWLVEIDEGKQITMVTDWGASRAVLPAPAPEFEQGAARTTFRATTEAHSLTLLLEAEVCQDTMSGEAFPTTVTATFDGREYRGCGRWLMGSAKSVSNIETWVGRKLVRKGDEARAGSRDILERDLPEPYRVLLPDTPMDRMYSQDRLNVLLDANGLIQDVFFG